jgi:hypothetical protein
MTIDEAESALTEARKKWLESAIAQPQKADEEERWAQYSSAFEDFRRACSSCAKQAAQSDNDGETVEGLGDA